MPTREYFIEHIEKELAAASEARANENEGRARVCARRAAGYALAWHLTKHPRAKWGSNAMSPLSAMKDDQSFPPAIREAAARLTRKISDRFTYPFATAPVEDAKIIVDYVQSRMD